MQALVVTLRRGLAGKRAAEISAALSLGLRKPNQVALQPNTASVRGQVAKLKDLVSVELVEAYVARQQAEAARCALREPLVLLHPPRKA